MAVRDSSRYTADQADRQRAYDAWFRRSCAGIRELVHPAGDPASLLMPGVPGQTYAYYGCHQNWYPLERQRIAGCGPTAAANLSLWLSESDPERWGVLGPDGTPDRGSMTRLMQAIWPFVTPRALGLYRAVWMTNGMPLFAKSRGIGLSMSALDIPDRKRQRPSAGALYDFISEALRRGSPVPFLNLNNGGVPGLDSWHWVTITGMDAARPIAVLSDAGQMKTVDLEQWLRMSTLGGAFVRAEI